MKRVLIFLLCGVLVLCPALTLYADNLDWKTSEFSFEYDGITFNHHSDGTCDILNADGSINCTMSKEETEKKFKAMGISFDNYGNVQWNASFIQDVLSDLGLSIGAVGSFLRIDSVTDKIRDLIVDSNTHTVSEAYFTNSFADGVTVDNNGNINLTSDKVDEIIKLMKKQYREYVGLYNVSELGTREMTLQEALLYMNDTMGFGADLSRSIYDWFIDNGYDSIYMYTNIYKERPRFVAFRTDSYSYAYSEGNGVAYADSDGYVITDPSVKGNTFGLYVSGYNINNVSDIESKSERIWRMTAPSFSGSDCLTEGTYYHHIAGTKDFKYYTSRDKMLSHAFGIGDTAETTFYYTNEFKEGAHPDGITITPEMLNEDWEKHNQDIIDAIEKGIEGITDAAERQEKINSIINNYLQKINDSISDINDTVEQANRKTNSLLREILQAIEDFNSDFNSFIKTSDTQILNDIKNNLLNLTNTVKDLAKDVSKIKTLNELQLAIQALDLVDLDGLKIEINTDFQLCADKIKTKFPTCALFDIAVVANMLSAEPAAPVVQYKFTIASAGIEYPVNIDFSILDNYIEYFRGAQVILFILSLIKFTISLFVKGGDF